MSDEYEVKKGERETRCWLLFLLAIDGSACFKPEIKSFHVNFRCSGDLLLAGILTLEVLTIFQHPFSLHVHPILFFTFSSTH